MALMQSCCCWRSLRKGSYASSVYTFCYFTLIVIIIFNFLFEERSYWFDGVESLRSPSFLEPEAISPTSMGLHVALMICASFGVFASFLLAYGVYTDRRVYLVPWIFVVISTAMVDLTHTAYVLALETVIFNPETAILFTMDFFLLSLNLYCLLCVVSQYQEYKAGRGTAEHDSRISLPRFKAPTQVGFHLRKRANKCISTTGRPSEEVAAYVDKKINLVENDLHSSAIPREATPQKSGRKHVQFSTDLLLHPQKKQPGRIPKGEEEEVNEVTSSWSVPADDTQVNVGQDEEPLIVDSILNVD